MVSDYLMMCQAPRHYQALLHLVANCLLASSPIIPLQGRPALLMETLRGPQPDLGSHPGLHSIDSLSLSVMTLVFVFPLS